MAAPQRTWTWLPEIEAKIVHNAYDQVAEIDTMQKVQMETLEAIHELQKQMAKPERAD